LIIARLISRTCFASTLAASTFALAAQQPVATVPNPLAEKNVSIEQTDPGPTAFLLSAPGPTFTVPAADIPKQWTVIGYGDTRFTNPANVTVTNPTVRRWIVNQIATEHPDALLVSGDLPYDGAVMGDYDVFRAETKPWRDAHLRVYPALGNHEVQKNPSLGMKNWWAAFPELNRRRWYSVSFGNAYFIALDSDLPLSLQSIQQSWLADQLDHLPRNVHFVFLTLHHPPVAEEVPGQTHYSRPNERELATFLNARAPKLRAKLIVIAGHIHNYERFSQSGVTYLVSGGGAAKPYPVPRSNDDLFPGKDPINYHFISFHFDGHQLNATMHRVDQDSRTPQWSVKDSFTIKP
jgi:3',5'-cyclic AMP phosphodiesterase CpdA